MLETYGEPTKWQRLLRWWNNLKLKEEEEPIHVYVELSEADQHEEEQ